MPYSLIVYLITWLTGWGRFYNKEFVTEAAKSLGWSALSPGVFILLFFVVKGVIGLFGSMSTALDEEIGWGGFLVPHLHNVTGYTYISLIRGMIWALWHYRLIIWGHYNGSTPVWYGLTCFRVAVVSAGFIYTWLGMKSGSLWTGVMLHASHNLFIQSFFHTNNHRYRPQVALVYRRIRNCACSFNTGCRHLLLNPEKRSALTSFISGFIIFLRVFLSCLRMDFLYLKKKKCDRRVYAL